MSTTSPNMGLVIPTVGVDTGPTWADDINASLSIIDGHNHAGGSGVPITPDGLSINSDLTFANNSATNLKAAIFTAQASFSTADSLYVKGVDLYFRDGSSNEIRITSGAAVNATSSGISSGTNTASFVGSVLVVNAASTTPANVQCGSVLLGNNSAGSKYLTLAPPNAMAADYSLVLPSLPASTKIMACDSSGNMTAAYSVDNSTITISANVIGVPNLGISTAKIANQAVTAAKVANATLTGTQMVSNINLPGGAVQVSGANVVSSSVNTTNGLSVIRGAIASTGAIVSGEGFSVAHPSGGVYTVTFTNLLSDEPAVICQPIGTVLICTVVVITPGLSVSVQFRDTSGTLTDTYFYMIVMGQR